MNNGVTLEEGLLGRRAVLNATWSDTLLKYFIKHEVADLEINTAKGWTGNNLSFLKKMPFLRSLKVLDLSILDINDIHCLHDLRTLEVTTYCTTAINFDSFPRLEKCALEWRSGSNSLFRCTSLKYLFVNHYLGVDLLKFSSLVNLEYLAILNSTISSLNGISPLTKLTSLRLANLSRLTCLSDINALTSLEELNMNTCRKVSSINALKSMTKLRQLQLNNMGGIESLSPIENLAQLEALSFYESTNILDGNISFLTGLTKLGMASFQNRKHYSHRREYFDFSHKKETFLRATKWESL